ncbi:MFS transporter [Natronospora cellulosivora (SeqCode)]
MLKEKLNKKLLFFLFSGYMTASLNIQGIQALMPFIQEDFGISRTEAGLFSTFFFVSAISIALFSGNIVDRIGSKKGLSIGIISTGGLIVLHAFSPIYFLILILAFLLAFVLV